MSAPSKTTFVPASNCPNCGTQLDAATHPTEDVSPSPGDVTVCLHCQEILRFDATLALVRPTPQEIEAICKDQPELRAMIFKYQRAAAVAMDKRQTP